MDFEVMLNPQKYGYVECGHCNGYGSSLKEASDRCTKCSGTGLVKEEKWQKQSLATSTDVSKNSRS